MSFILSCDFWFCCGSASDPADCQQPPVPYAEPTQPQTQVVTVMQSPGQLPPPISSNQLPPPLPAAPALPSTVVYNLHPPGTIATRPSPHVPNREIYYYLPPPNMEKPARPSTPSHVTSFKQYNMLPQPAIQEPPKAYGILPQSTQMTPHIVPSSKVHEPVTSAGPPLQADHSAIQPSNTDQTLSIANQQWAPPIVPPKRPAETTVPTFVPMHTPAPAQSKVHNPVQQPKLQTTLHSGASDEPLKSHITTETPPPPAVFPARQSSKTYQNLSSMNQRSMSHVPSSKRYDNPVPTVAPMHAHPPVQSKVPDPLSQSKKRVPSSVPSTKAHDVPPPAQVLSQHPPQAVWLAHQPSNIYQKSPSINQQLVPPHAASKRHETSVEAVVKTKSSKYAELSM